MPKKGKFPRIWKTANIALAIPGQEKSMDLSKYRPISLLKFGWKCSKENPH